MATELSLFDTELQREWLKACATQAEQKLYSLRFDLKTCQAVIKKAGANADAKAAAERDLKTIRGNLAVAEAQVEVARAELAILPEPPGEEGTE